MVNTDFTAAMSLLCYHFLKENRQLLNIHKYEREVVQLVDCYIDCLPHSSIKDNC